jgi:hypothetical protein
MYVIVNVTGCQGFMPGEIKDDVIKQQAFAQNMIDAFCNTEYFDPEVIEYYEIPSLWYRMKMWLKACPLRKQRR